MVPDTKDSDFERIRWDSIPSKLRGNVVTLDELMESFPENSMFYKVRAGKTVKPNRDLHGYTEYVRSHKNYSYFLEQKLAYECGECKKIVIGPPDFKDEDSISNGTLSGRRGYDIICTNCHSTMCDYTYESS
ncbi:MAG: hypothetical protein V1914_00480 [archaeon]